jgi:hypothetical protein
VGRCSTSKWGAGLQDEFVIICPKQRNVNPSQGRARTSGHKMAEKRREAVQGQVRHRLRGQRGVTARGNRHRGTAFQGKPAIVCPKQRNLNPDEGLVRQMEFCTTFQELQNLSMDQLLCMLSNRVSGSS